MLEGEPSLHRLHEPLLHEISEQLQQVGSDDFGVDLVLRWEDDRLVGGLYGVGIGGLFAGESMFHRRTDASKVALVRLVEELSADGVDRLLDVQWLTAHLASLGAEEISRAEYLTRLAVALKAPAPAAWASG